MNTVRTLVLMSTIHALCMAVDPSLPRLVADGGHLGRPIFPTDPFVLRDDEGLHLFVTTLFADQFGETGAWTFDWDPADPSHSDISRSIGSTAYAFSADDGESWQWRSDPVVLPGAAAWQNEKIETAFLQRDGDLLRLYYSATGDRAGSLFYQRFQIGIAELDLDGATIREALLDHGATFTPQATPLIPYNTSETAVSNNVQEPSVVVFSDRIELFVIGLSLVQPAHDLNNSGNNIQGIHFLRYTFDRQLSPLTGPEELSISPAINIPEVLYRNGRYEVWYTTLVAGGEFHENEAIRVAYSQDGITWGQHRDLVAPNRQGSYDNWGIMAPTVAPGATSDLLIYTAWQRLPRAPFPVPSDGRFGGSLENGSATMLGNILQLNPNTQGSRTISLHVSPTPGPTQLWLDHAHPHLHESQPMVINNLDHWRDHIIDLVPLGISSPQ